MRHIVQTSWFTILLSAILLQCPLSGDIFLIMMTVCFEILIVVLIKNGRSEASEFLKKNEKTGKCLFMPRWFFKHKTCCITVRKYYTCHLWLVFPHHLIFSHTWTYNIAQWFGICKVVYKMTYNKLIIQENNHSDAN